MPKPKTPDLIEAQERGRFIKSGLFPLEELSFHKGIINLLNKESGLVWSLISEQENMTAFSLLVPDLFIGRNELSSFREGNSFIDEYNLRLGRTTINFGQSPLWAGASPTLTENPEKREIERSLIVNQLDHGDSFLSLLANDDKTVFQEKAREIIEKNIRVKKGTLYGLEKFVGLGQGMTPAGDDFITGVLLAEECRNLTFRIDKAKIADHLEKTTAPGRTMLYAALRGSFPSFILRYVESIETTDSPEKIIYEAKAAAKHGSTSGRDCLAGFYWDYRDIS